MKAMSLKTHFVFHGFGPQIVQNLSRDTEINQSECFNFQALEEKLF